MSRKIRKNSTKQEDTQVVKTDSSKEETKTVTKKLEPVKMSPLISFDVFFQILMKKNQKIRSHHKAPMRKFAEKRGLKTEATYDQFEKIFKNY